MPLLKRLFPNIVVAVAIGAIMVGAYEAVAMSGANGPRAIWLKDPLRLTFQASAGRGGAVDSVTCNRATTDLVFDVHVSKPNLLALATLPTFWSCDSSPMIVTVTATCLVPAAQCRGSYQGLVRIRQPTNYRDIPANLQVDIVVS